MSQILAWIKKYDFGIIMLLAFLVRMIGYRWMGYTNFPEFYRDYYMVSHIAHGQVVLLGPPSMLHGFHFGPFYYYSMLPMFLLFWGHPFSLIFTGIIFSVLTVYAFYKILLLWFNSRSAAITGALFMALSVYSLHLASYVSNPNFLPLFALWYFYYLTKVLQSRTAAFNVSSRPRSASDEWRVPSTHSQMHSGSVGMTDYIYLGLAFGLATQLHATAAVILPLVSIAAIITQKYKPKPKTAAIFLAAVIFTYLPYLFFEFANNFSNLKRLFILGTKELSGQHSGSGVTAVWNFFQGTLTPFNGWYTYTNIYPNYLNIIVGLLALFAAAMALYRIFKKPRPVQTDFAISKVGGIIVLFWTVFTCTILLLFNRGVHDHYIIVLWPVPLIFLIYAIFWLKAKFNVFVPLVALIVITSLLQIYSFWQFGHTPWSDFMPVYQQHYQNDPTVPEIGS